MTLKEVEKSVWERFGGISPEVDWMVNDVLRQAARAREAEPIDYRELEERLRASK
jgi:hypothetical protein